VAVVVLVKQIAGRPGLVRKAVLTPVIFLLTVMDI
jgi:hypothetical protein